MLSCGPQEKQPTYLSSGKSLPKRFIAGLKNNCATLRFRYDGIVDLANAQPEVVPVNVERRESDKYRLQWRLVAGSASEFPESVLTLEEQVNTQLPLSIFQRNRPLRAIPLFTFPGSTITVNYLVLLILLRLSSWCAQHIDVNILICRAPPKLRKS